MDLRNLELMEVLFMHSALLELHLELSKDTSECLVLALEVLDLLLELLVLAFHFAVDLVYLFQLLLGLLLVSPEHTFIWVQEGGAQILACIAILI